MAVDLSVFGRQKTIIDQQQLQQAFEAKKQAQQLQALGTVAALQQQISPQLSPKDLLNFQMQAQQRQDTNELRRLTMENTNAYRNANLDLKRDEKQSKIDEKTDAMTQGKQSFEDSLSNLANYYSQLKEGGGTTSVDDNALSNMAGYLQNSSAGQGMGQLFGTENQSIRNKIAAELPLLTQSIKSATGMSAQQMNSNVELQTFLKSLGSNTGDYESNIGIISNLSNKFGTGEVGKSFSTPKPAAGGAPVTATGANGQKLQLINGAWQPL